jgi:hypothetical protein
MFSILSSATIKKKKKKINWITKIAPHEILTSRNSDNSSTRRSENASAEYNLRSSELI